MWTTHGWMSNATLTDIGNAIRTVAGTDITYKPTEMASAISALSPPSSLDNTATLWMQKELTEFRNNTIEHIPDNAFGYVYWRHYPSFVLADLGVAKTIGVLAFSNSGLTTLIIRTNIMCTIDSSSLRDTPIADGTGYIYVPSALIDTYKADEIWATYTDRFRAIESYPDVCG